MKLFVPAVLVVLVGFMLLLPPLALVRSVAKMHWGPRSATPYISRVFWTFAALLPLIINAGYFSTIWAELAAGALNPDQNMAIAVLISWGSFWGRVAMGRKHFGQKTNRT